EDADAQVLRFGKLFLPAAFRGPRILWLIALIAATLAYPSYRLFGFPAGAVSCVVEAVFLGLIARFFILKAGRKQIEAERAPLLSSLARADALVAKSESYIESTFRTRVDDATRRRDSESNRADKTRNQIITESEATRAAKVREADELEGSRRT